MRGMGPTGFAQIEVAARYRSSPGFETRPRSWPFSTPSVSSIKSVIVVRSPRPGLVEWESVVTRPPEICRRRHHRPQPMIVRLGAVPLDSARVTASYNQVDDLDDVVGVKAA